MSPPPPPNTHAHYRKFISKQSKFIIFLLIFCFTCPIEQGDDSGVSGALLAGIIAGAVVLLAIVGFVVFIFIRRKRSPTMQQSPTTTLAPQTAHKQYPPLPQTEGEMPGYYESIKDPHMELKHFNNEGFYEEPEKNVYPSAPTLDA